MKVIWVPRTTWGSTTATEEFIRDRAKNHPATKTEIHVHHTAAVDDNDDTPNRWDYDEAVAYMKRLQWVRPDLGPLPYSENLAVSEDLEVVWVFQGRGMVERGAHTGGHNVAGVGWGVFGNFDQPDAPAAAALIVAIQHQAHLYKTDVEWGLVNLGSVKSPNGWTAWGHRDTSSKTCPGHSLYPQLADFTIQPIDEGEPMLPLEKGMNTEDVTLLKDLLNRTYGENLSLWPSGYNAATVRAVKEHLGRYTGHPQWKEGKGVGGRQWAELWRAFILKTAGGEGALINHGHRVPGGVTGNPIV